jgi:hypothetical protein
MARGGDKEKGTNPHLQQMSAANGVSRVLPPIANLPAAYAYRCMPCVRVETIVLGGKAPPEFALKA